MNEADQSGESQKNTMDSPPSFVSKSAKRKKVMPPERHLCGSDQCLYARDATELRKELAQIRTDIAVIKQNFIDMKEFVTIQADVRAQGDRLKELENHAVLRVEFDFIKRAVLAGVGAVCLGVIAAVIKLLTTH